jgi:hypothetical protein
MHGLFDKTNEYDVSQYTDEELYKILDMNHPSDRELEAKLIGLVNKYNSFENETGDRIAQFYVEIYRRFFETDVDIDEEPSFDNETEGFTNMSNPTVNASDPGLSYTKTNTSIQLTGQRVASNPNQVQVTTPLGVSNQPALGQQTFNMGNVLDTTTDYRKSDTLLTKPVDYTKDKLNPLLTQTVRRILSVDSQYRDNKGSTSSTEFTFNLSEPLRDVVALKLYSVGIPYAWYTISKAYGANFFYIKGNSPGIDTGDFDYQVAIQPGNYDAPGLVSNLNTSIRQLMSTYTDMSFGNTQVIYNNGSTSTTSGTGLSTIQIDLKKVFNESNYYIHFPTWSSTVNSITSYPQLNSIPSYMGFNEQTYNGTSIFSNLFSSISSNATDRNQVFNVSTMNATFKIISYTGGNSLSTSTAIYNTIPVSIDLGGLTSASYTRDILVTKLNDALKSNTTYLDTNYSGLYWRDISGVLQAYNQQSYMEMQIKLNSKIAPMVNDLKMAVVFPDVSSYPIFAGSNSCFRFSNQYGTWTDQSNILYYVNELSDLYSEVPILQSNYTPGNTNVIKLLCTASGYELFMNNYSIDMSSSLQYNLDDYLSFINTNIQTKSSSIYNNEIYGSVGTQTQIRQDAASNILFDVHVKKIFTTNNYAVVATGAISELFTMDTSGSDQSLIVTMPDIYNVSGAHQVTAWDLSKKNVFSNNTYTLTTTNFDASSTLQIYPQTNTTPPYNANVAGNKNAVPFVVNFESGATFQNIAALVSYLNTKLTTFSVNVVNKSNPSVSSTKNPFYNSSITYDTTNGYSLNLNVGLELTQEDYILDLSTAVQIRTDLSFNSTYTLTNYQVQNSLVATVQNNEPKPDSLINIDANNNQFSFYPYSTIIGLQTSTNLYKITVTIPNGIYNIKALHDTINAQLDANSISKGTAFSTYKKTDGSIYTKIRMNFNKVFSTKDFRLVFYDPYSFVTCTSGATRSIQNVTWDTTVGWILGFRENIIYYLIDYIGYSYSYNTTLTKYYMTGSQSNVCMLVSDTAVNTNLYSYFLIVLDDYVQNHLNDGLVKITNQETNIAPEPHIMVCDPVTKQTVSRPADWGSPGITYTERELYAFSQKVDSQLAKVNSYSKGPFVKDIFGFIPLKPGNIGSMYSEFGGTLQNQDRMYFGPVNIHRMTIRLLNDRGDLVDLNNNDWNFSLVCEQLYRNSTNI